MKIESITVKNFKGCPDGTYNLSKLNMLIGKNGKGKTSFQLALRYLLNGKLPADPIRHGNEILYVSGIIEEMWKLQENIIFQILSGSIRMRLRKRLLRKKSWS